MPKGFKHDPPPTTDEFVAILKSAQSSGAACWILEGLRKPSDADVKMLARFLDGPDAELRWSFVERLTAWYGLPGPEEPLDILDPPTTSGMTSHREYPGLDAAVAFWKARLKAQ